MQDKWINTAQAAEYTGFAASTLNKLRCSGGGPHYSKRGKAVRYRLSDLEDWMVGGCINSTSQSTA
ncbi:helix-turn-helix domain-containing protein [Parasphingopyxis sp. CP4]|uniref:helix-turn-helix transcriptional regulator n=1 Tax=Parasphingopyxis sp. CP4 TaxID=2724527 RepID=UPI0015A19A70|nr:helix-turn-helix domain-containing protein [Parasphingopyxis sp. CP4]